MFGLPRKICGLLTEIWRKRADFSSLGRTRLLQYAHFAYLFGIVTQLGIPCCQQCDGDFDL